MAAKIIGFCGIDNNGRCGLESFYNEDIGPKTSRFSVVKDAFGRQTSMPDTISILEKSAPYDLALTVDERIQYVAEKALERQVTRFSAAGGIAMVMDPMTGDILAIAEQPKYNPNDVASYPTKKRQSNAVSTPIEPGSTFKLFVAATALEANLANLDERLIATTDAVYANSWAIEALNDASLGLAIDNSWAILALDNRLDVVEPLTIQNSNAIVAHSGHLINLDDRLVATTDAVYANSWAISALDGGQTALNDLTEANSWAIVRHNEEIFAGAKSGLDTALAGASVSHGANVYSMDWSPDNQYLALGGVRTSSISVRVYQFSGETTLSELAGCQIDHGEAIRAIAWHPSGQFLAMAGDNGTSNYNVRIYSFNGTSLSELTGCRVDTPASVYSLAWTSDGWNLAIGGSAGFIEISVRDGNAQEKTSLKMGDPVVFQIRS